MGGVRAETGLGRVQYIFVLLKVVPVSLEVSPVLFFTPILTSQLSFLSFQVQEWTGVGGCLNEKVPV